MWVALNLKKLILTDKRKDERCFCYSAVVFAVVVVTAAAGATVFNGDGENDGDGDCLLRE